MQWRAVQRSARLVVWCGTLGSLASSMNDASSYNKRQPLVTHKQNSSNTSPPTCRVKLSSFARDVSDASCSPTARRYGFRTAICETARNAVIPNGPDPMRSMPKQRMASSSMGRMPSSGCERTRGLLGAYRRPLLLALRGRLVDRVYSQHAHARTGVHFIAQISAQPIRHIRRSRNATCHVLPATRNKRALRIPPARPC